MMICPLLSGICSRGDVRQIDKVVGGMEIDEGEATSVIRGIGKPNKVHHLDPFLLMDEFTMKPPSGFPPHPHRGFETVTYLLQGQIRYHDHKGTKGIIHEGDLQWVTTGKGIVHSEMPGASTATGIMIWVNLKSWRKMVNLEYQHVLAEDIPTVDTGSGAVVKVLAGTSHGRKSPIQVKTPVEILFVTLKPNGTFTQPTPANWPCFAYVLDGGMVYFGPENNRKGILPQQTAIFSQGGVVQAENMMRSSECRFILGYGEPIEEDIIQEGPFIMNQKYEINQAYDDFADGVNGFENGKEFRHKWTPEEY